jgi:hypothetical protein
MPLDVKRVEYYEVAISDDIAAGARMLAAVAGAGADFLAYKAIRRGPGRTRFTLFPENGSILREGAARAGLELEGPHPAVLIKGHEEQGALSRIYERLSQAGIRVQEACGIARINGGYGIVLFLTAEDCDRAVAAINSEELA